MRPGVGV